MDDLVGMEGNKNLTRESASRIFQRARSDRNGLSPSPHCPAAILLAVVYVKGTPAGALVDAVVKMAEGRDLHASMNAVRAAVATPQNEALDIVAKIRALVRDPDPPDETT